MIEFFRNPSSIAVVQDQPPAWEYVRRQLNTDVERIRSYYQAYPAHVHSEHPLANLLNTLGVPIHHPLDRFYANVDARSIGHSVAHGFTSVISAGRIHQGGFMTQKSPEIYLATDEFFNYRDTHQNWQNAQPVKILQHWREDFRLDLPLGNNLANTADKVSVILVNIPMLAVQYRAFQLHEMKLRPDAPRSVMQFIGGYVLPNMTASNLELCLFNKMMRLSQQVDYYPQGYNRSQAHPFPLITMSNQIDTVLTQSIQKAQNGVKRFEVILQQLPSFGYKSQYHQLMMSHLAPTRQIDWSMTLCRLRAFTWVAQMAGVDAVRSNQNTLNEFFKNLRRNDVLQVMIQQLTKPIQQTVANEIKTLLTLSQRSYI